MGRLHRKIMAHREEIVDVEPYYLDGGDLDGVIVSYGFTARSALHVVEQLRAAGMKVGMIRLKTIWPFADQAIEEVSRRTRWILVPEMNMGQVVHQVRQVAACEVFALNQTNGRTIHPRRIEEEMRRRL